MARREKNTVETTEQGGVATMDAAPEAQAQPETSAAESNGTVAKRDGTVYKLNGKDVPQALVGKALRFPEAKSLVALREQVADGADEHIVRAAQGAIDIVRQGRARALSGSDEVAEILAGKADGSEGLDDEGRVTMALEYIQGELDEWRYGSVVRGTGTGAATRAEADQAKKIKEAAAADPELAAKLAALGITLSTAK